MRNIVIGVIAAIVIIGGGYLLIHSNDTPPPAPTPAPSPTAQAPSPTPTTPTTTPPTPTPNPSEPTVAATITYNSSGFSPAVTTVKSGDVVAIKNTTGKDIQFQSDPHPSHTDDTDLNAGLVPGDHVKTFTVTKTGTFGYHNHLDPTQTGTIVIQ